MGCKLILISSAEQLVSNLPLQLCLLGLLPLPHYFLSVRAGPMSAVNNSSDDLGSSAISSASWSQTTCDASSVFRARTSYHTCLARFYSLKLFHNFQCWRHWQLILVFANKQNFTWQKVSVEPGSKCGCWPQCLFSRGGRDFVHQHPCPSAAIWLLVLLTSGPNIKAWLTTYIPPFQSKLFLLFPLLKRI